MAAETRETSILALAEKAAAVDAEDVPRFYYEWDGWSEFVPACDPQTIASAMRVIQATRYRKNLRSIIDMDGTDAYPGVDKDYIDALAEEDVALRAWDGEQ